MMAFSVKPYMLGSVQCQGATFTLVSQTFVLVISVFKDIY